MLILGVITLYPKIGMQNNLITRELTNNEAHYDPNYVP